MRLILREACYTGIPGIKRSVMRSQAHIGKIYRKQTRRSNGCMTGMQEHTITHKPTLEIRFLYKKKGMIMYPLFYCLQPLFYSCIKITYSVTKSTY